ncbi:MAG: hypothetical protein U0R72_19400 [Nakamurella multipartita]
MSAPPSLADPATEDDIAAARSARTAPDTEPERLDPAGTVVAIGEVPAPHLGRSGPPGPCAPLRRPTGPAAGSSPASSP